MKIAVVMPRYAVAGVPLAQMRFARALANRGHHVDLVVGRIDPEHPMPQLQDVNVVKLSTRNVRGMFVPLWLYLRKQKPDLVFSAEDHLNGVVLLAAISSLSKAMISGSSRVPPEDSYSNIVLSQGWLRKFLLRCVMWRADALTCVSKDMAENYKKYFPYGPHVFSYNIIFDRFAKARMREPVDIDWFNNKILPVVVAAGTLTERKGFSDLVNAVAAMISGGKQVRLLILGEGPLRGAIEKQVKELAIEEFVCLPGRIENPLKYFANSDVFVLSSYAEGLPNVLVEAMMCGCTPVSTDCPTGPREVLQDGKYGYLVPVGDPVALARGIEAALDRPIPRVLLDEAVRPFGEETVIRRHFDVLGLSEFGPGNRP